MAAGEYHLIKALADIGRRATSGTGQDDVYGAGERIQILDPTLGKAVLGTTLTIC